MRQIPKYYSTQIMKMKQKAFDVIDQSGLPSEICSLLKNKLRYTIQLNTKRLEDDAIPIGNTKFGGAPDLPEHIEWPKYSDEYMPFICQLNLQEITNWDYEGKLPDHGWIYVFDTQEPNDHGYRMIYYDGSISDLKPRSIDEDLIFEEGRLYPACEVSFAPEWMLATYSSGDFEDALKQHHIEEDPFDIYDKVETKLKEIFSYGGNHQLFGYAYMGSIIDDDNLLLEVGSDDNMDLMIWDAGLSQFFMPITDQKPFRSFDQVIRGIYSS